MHDFVHLCFGVSNVFMDTSHQVVAVVWVLRARMGCLLVQLTYTAQGRSRRSGRYGHGRTIFSLNLTRGQRARGLLSYGTQTTGVRHRGYQARRHTLEPFQLKHIAFPSRPFGKSASVNRSFQAMWFNKIALRCYVGC